MQITYNLHRIDLLVVLVLHQYHLAIGARTQFLIEYNKVIQLPFLDVHQVVQFLRSELLAWTVRGFSTLDVLWILYALRLMLFVPGLNRHVNTSLRLDTSLSSRSCPSRIGRGSFVVSVCRVLTRRAD